VESDKGACDSGAKGVGMGNRWLPSRIECGVASPLSFPHNDGVRYFDQALLREATDIGEGRGRDIK